MKITWPRAETPTHWIAHGFDEDRLPRAGFAGKDIQAGIELNLDRVDDREVPNA